MVKRTRRFCSDRCKWETSLPMEVILRVQKQFLSGEKNSYRELAKRFRLGHSQVVKAIDLLFGK